MTATVEVAEALWTDLDALVDLFDGYLTFYGRETPVEEIEDFLSDRLRHADSRIYCGRAEGDLVGFAQVYPTFSSLALSPVWVLNDLFVRPSARRIGVATALLTAVEREATRHDVLRIQLETASDNPAAQTLYAQHGYDRESESSDFLTMTKRLRPKTRG